MKKGKKGGKEKRKEGRKKGRNVSIDLKKEASWLSKTDINA